MPDFLYIYLLSGSRSVAGASDPSPSVGPSRWELRIMILSCLTARNIWIEQFRSVTEDIWALKIDIVCEERKENGLMKITNLNWLVRIVKFLDFRMKSKEGLNSEVDRASNLLYQQGDTEKLLVHI